MIELSLAEVAAAAGGTLAGGADAATRVPGPVVTDSRAVVPGALFVAVAGEHHDGHDFALDAVAVGASAALVTRDVGAPSVVVGEPLGALGRLARHVLDRLPDARVVGITGSSGKTGTKDLLADVLAGHAPTVATEASFNNELGLPLTVLRADPTTRLLVLEMGARGVGHIAHLCEVAPPAVAVVLNVGRAHRSEFGSPEGTARAKGELVEALQPDGVAVLNAADPLVAAMAARTSARVVTTSADPAVPADVRAADVELDAGGRPAYRLLTSAGTAPVRLRLVGRHHVANSLAVAAVAVEAGMAVADVAAAMSAAAPRSRWRMQVTERPDGVTVVNDAYNANPESMTAALDALAQLARGRRAWAVLGEMLELGPSSADDHAEVGAHAARLGLDHLVAVGANAAPIASGAADAGAGGGVAVATVADVDAAFALLERALRPGDVVLVKSSRDAGLRHLGDRLAAAGATP